MTKKTIRLRYAIQFAKRLPKFRGILYSSVREENAPVLREEDFFLVKVAIGPVLITEMSSGL
ncbi:MAG: hypothetical protein ACRCT2_16265, partial [Plesiomonas shigelloides]